MPPAIFKRPPPHPIPLQNFTVHRRFCPASISSFLRRADFSSCSKRQCVAFVSNTVSCVLSLCINCNFKTKWHSCSQYPTWNSWTNCSVAIVWPWAVSDGDIEEHKECHKVASAKSSIVFGRSQELFKAKATWASVEQGRIQDMKLGVAQMGGGGGGGGIQIY